jgi:predicted transcriptional regulator
MKQGRVWRLVAIVALAGVVALAVAMGSGAHKAARSLVLQADAVLGLTGAPGPQDICVASSQFQQGEEVVFRIKVYDPATGQAMDDQALDSVVVTLQDGQTFNAVYGGHPGGPGETATDYFWSAAWMIPVTYPTGSASFTVAARSKDGRTGTYSQFNVGPSLLTVLAAQPPAARTLVVDANTVIGLVGAPSPQDICIGSSQFQQGQEVVWQIKVYDPATGQTMDDTALDSVVVTLEDGQMFDARYGGHPGGTGETPTDYFWSAAWTIPANYPTGSAPFTVTAESKDGRTGTFSEFNVAPALLTVVAAQ